MGLKWLYEGQGCLLPLRLFPVSPMTEDSTLEQSSLNKSQNLIPSVTRVRSSPSPAQEPGPEVWVMQFFA